MVTNELQLKWHLFFLQEQYWAWYCAFKIHQGVCNLQIKNGVHDSYWFLRMQADFMKMLFPDNTFDAVYVIEATCQAPDAICIPNSNTTTLARMAHHFPLFVISLSLILLFSGYFGLNFVSDLNSMDVTKKYTEQIKA